MIDRLNGSPILSPDKAKVLCSATVQLISKLQRPYKFMVTVVGLPPHEGRRIYQIDANNDSSAAFAAIDKFVAEMSHPLHLVSAMV